MSRLRDALRAADPLQFELPPDERRRLGARREALALVRPRREAGPAAHHTPPRGGADAVPWRRVALAVGLCGAAAIAGLGLWQRGVTPALAAVRFEIRLAEEAAAPGLREAPVGSQPRLVYLHEATVVSNDHVATAQVTRGRDANHCGVEVVFTPEGARRMLQATSAHIGRPVALMVNGLVVAAPTVRSAIGERAVLTGDYSRADAERVARGLMP